MRAANVDAEIDALFQLPLSEFTSARNSLAARLKKEGRAADAERVKSLPKAPATAWAVNQLYWRHRKAVDGFFALGARARNAQTGGGADLRELLDERRVLLSDLTNRAAAILSEAGHAVTPDAARRMSISLESLSAWNGTEGTPRPGRLTSDLEPLGFDGLAALMGGKKLQPAKVLQFRIERERASSAKKNAEEEAAARARAKEALKSAEKTAREARRAAEQAGSALDKANARAADVEKQRQEIEARFTKAKDEARTASNAARKAAQALADAERALERARAALGDLES